MCGIAGLGNFGAPVDEAVLDRMCRVMEHRGPDSAGVHLEPGIALGMRRLAIIDVAGGEQPIYNEDGSVVVVANGEIYNHDELRQSLRRRGHKFDSRCDTEVLVHLYEEYGADLVHHLRGMFAFAIWDARKRRLLCARDRVGKKPLFWARHGDRFWFGSEVRSLLQDPSLSREIDPGAIDAYLALQYVPHPMSAFRDIRKLPPASTLSIDETTTEVERYWRLDYSAKIDAADEAEIRERLWDEIKEATRIRLMSDVPLGAFLSGGIDSSAVVAAMAEQTSEPVRTFSIGFRDRDFDEAGYARTVAEQFSTQHTEFRVEPEALSIMPKLARHYGEPFADSSAIPSFYLAELTSRQVTVALNGDGGDESFGGYGRYLRGIKLARFGWLPSPMQRAAPALAPMLGRPRDDRSVRARAQRLARSLGAPAWQRYSMSLTAFDRDSRDRLVSPEFLERLDSSRAESLLADAWDTSTADTDLERMMDVDVQTYLPGDLLPKIDIATMAHSLEARSPFLDHRLMEFAASLPASMKLDGGVTKRILKATLRGRLPDAILDRPKMGFGVPLARWFREDLRDLPAEHLLDPSSLSRGYFRRSEVERILSEHREGSNDHSLRIWVLLQLEMWHREVVEAPIADSTPVA
jgi:asparagine synthase (glutamine-hydrolysing)